MTWQDATKSLTDLIFSGVSRAVRASGIVMEDIESVVLSAHDLIDGRSLSSMVTAPAAGAYLRDEIRLSDDGLAALSLAAARIEAGEVGASIVAAWARASEGEYLTTSRASMDPFLQQPFGLSELDIPAFRLSRWLAHHGGRDGERAAAARARAARAAANPHAVRGSTRSVPLAYPLREEDAPKWCDIVVAMVVSATPSGIAVAGTGHGSDMADVGQRDLLDMPALKTAVHDALDGSDTALDEIAILELDGTTLPDDALAMEALGICAPGSGFAACATDDRVNASGGSAAGWCYPAMGLVRAAEACFRLERLPAGTTPVRALATGNGAGGAQTTHAVVLERT